MIEALTLLDRISCIKMCKNNVRSKLFYRIAKRSMEDEMTSHYHILALNLTSESFLMLLKGNAKSFLNVWLLWNHYSIKMFLMTIVYLCKFSY